MDAPLRKSTGMNRSFIRKVNGNLLIRRTHLYSGLFLVPWVLLYGFTAFLFNHPEVLSRTENFNAPYPAGFEDWSDPNAIADQVIAALSKDQKVAVEKIGRASFSGQLAARFNGEQNGNLRLDLEEKTISMSIRPGDPASSPGPLDGKFLQEKANLKAKKISGILTPFLQGQGFKTESLRIRSIPDVEFNLKHQGQEWKARYNLEKGMLTATNGEVGTGPNWRTFLLRLHKTHVYSSNPARWVWALIVDIMAMAMVVWGLSGIYMWWKMKKLRSVGKWIILASLISAFGLGTAMYLLAMS